MRRTFPEADIYPMYGLTEAFRSTYHDPALVADHPNSMGRAIPYAEILVCRPDGRVASDAEPVALVHTVPLVAQRYWRAAERTPPRAKPAPATSRYACTSVWSGAPVHRYVYVLQLLFCR